MPRGHEINIFGEAVRETAPLCFVSYSLAVCHFADNSRLGKDTLRNHDRLCSPTAHTLRLQHGSKRQWQRTERKITASVPKRKKSAPTALGKSLNLRKRQGPRRVHSKQRVPASLPAYHGLTCRAHHEPHPCDNQTFCFVSSWHSRTCPALRPFLEATLTAPLSCLFSTSFAQIELFVTPGKGNLSRRVCHGPLKRSLSSWTERNQQEERAGHGFGG